MSTYVGPVGPTNEPILALVGEAPGVTEDQLGEPFVGSSGRLLDSMLQGAGLNRADCYITNVAKHRPPANDFGVFYEDSRRSKPTPQLIKLQDQLRQELKRVKPKVIVTLGGEALKALADKTSVTKWRGSVLETKLGLIIPTFHPASVLRMYSQRVIVEYDLRKALRIAKEGFEPQTFEFLIDPSFEQVMDELDKLLANPPEFVTFDIEAYGRVVRCLGLGLSPTKAICIPFTCDKNHVKVSKNPKALFLGDAQSGTKTSFWEENEELEIWKKLKRILEDPRIKKVAQNFPYDSTRLYLEHGVEVRGLWMDTMVAQHCCYSELPKSLDFLTSIYTDIGYYADYSPSSDLSTWKYNCYDCVATWQCCKKLESELHSLDQWEFYKNHAEPVMVALTRMQNRGVDVDVEKLESLKTQYEQRLEKTLTELKNLFGREVNPDSPKQVQEVLYRDLGLPSIVHRKTKRPTASKEAIEELARKFPNIPALRKIVRYRSDRVVLSSFLDKSKLSESNKFKTSFNATGTVTGRISSSKTIDGEGGNLQNQPKKIRGIYVPPPNQIWIKVDLSQAEARVVAWVAGIREMIERWSENRDWDIHTWNAAKNIFRIDEKDVTKEQRQLSKAGVHGGNYKLGYRTASQHFKISFQDAKLAIDSYRAAVGELYEWWDKVEQEVIRTRKIKNLLGRQRVFLGRLDDETFRSAIACIPQGTIADLINRALVFGELILPELGFKQVVQVHDEIDLVGPKSNMLKACKILKNLLEIPLHVEGVKEPLVIPAEFCYGPTWKDATEPMEI